MTQLPVGPHTSDEAARWQAVRDRNAAADGAFYLLNRHTGVYCRPSCPSKRGRGGHLHLVARLAEVGAGGFRPCARCTPDRVTGRERALALTLHLLDTEMPTPSLTELARAAGLSPSHLQRVFTQAVGLSPKHLRAGRAGRALQGPATGWRGRDRSDVRRRLSVAAHAVRPGHRPAGHVAGRLPAGRGR